MNIQSLLLYLSIVFLTYILCLSNADLNGNPVAEESNYKERVLRCIPSLEILDNHAVSMKDKLIATGINRSTPMKQKDGDHTKSNRNKISTSHRGVNSLKELLYREVCSIRIRREEEEQRKTITLFDTQHTTNDKCPLPTALDFLNNTSSLSICHNGVISNDVGDMSMNDSGEMKLSEWDKHALYTAFKRIYSKVSSASGNAIIDTTKSNTVINNKVITSSNSNVSSSALALQSKYLMDVMHAMVDTTGLVILSEEHAKDIIQAIVTQTKRGTLTYIHPCILNLPYICMYSNM